ncbi:hypothetical protein [Streptomyces sp. NPDC005548]|uniref:hypothetical protein n=1 Tax=Streptomyces sp. NPDC005548 TaxID=3364724 RepID=UPI0036BB52C1
MLTQLAGERPRLAAALLQSERQRARHTASLLTGARFKGLDELLRHLDDLVRAFEADSELSRLSFLVARSAADFETAVEATVSGYLAVASDAMRDVMEIENLLLDFAVDPGHIDDWLTADQRTIRNKFSPPAVRKRLHAAGEAPYATTAASLDYQAHSAALHVGPHQHPVAAKGFSADRGWDGDAGFWEIFEHARRLHRAIRRVTNTLAAESAADLLAARELHDVQDAWQRTQEMQAVYLALLTASVEAQLKGGEDS